MVMRLSHLLSSCLQLPQKEFSLVTGSLQYLSVQVYTLCTGFLTVYVNQLIFPILLCIPHKQP